jgi:hypothetical protein
VKDGRAGEAEALLKEGFKKQDEGTFNKMYLLSVTPKYFDLIKPECLEELKDAMANFQKKD